MNRTIIARFISFAFLLLILPLGLLAQGDIKVKEDLPLRQNFMVHYSLSQHLNFIRPSVRLGFENRVNESLYLNAEIGYIYKGTNRSLLSRSEIPRNGYHFAIEPKIYPFQSPNKRKHSTYFSWNISFDKIFEDQTDFVPRAGGAFHQKFDFSITEATYTLMFTVGRTVIHSTPLNVDMYIGLGARNSVISTSGLPDDVVSQTLRPSFSQWSGNKNYRPAFQIGIFLTFPGLFYPTSKIILESPKVSTRTTQ